MNYLIIDYIGIKEKILSSDDIIISNVFSGPCRYDCNITINYSDLTLYKLNTHFIGHLNNTTDIVSNIKIPYVYITSEKSRIYKLSNVIIYTLEYSINNDIKISLIADYLNVVSEYEIKEMEISLRKDKIKKILYKIKK